MKLFDSNPVALVTGASRGIGRATAEYLALEGARVIVNYNNSERQASEVVHNITSHGGRAISIKADVSKMDEVAKMAEQALSTFGSVDILVNNAGMLPRPGDWKNITEEVWQLTLDINLKGVFNCIKCFSPFMLKRSWGRIVNISSTYGIFGATNVVAYVAAKAGVITLTRAFAKELAPAVTVNCIAPGHIKTDLTPKVPGFVERISDVTPMKRLGTSEEAAWAIAFLASDRASFITGEILALDGGHILK